VTSRTAVGSNLGRPDACHETSTTELVLYYYYYYYFSLNLASGPRSWGTISMDRLLLCPLLMLILQPVQRVRWVREYVTVVVWQTAKRLLNGGDR